MEKSNSEQELRQYVVSVKELHTQKVLIKAKDEKDALFKVSNGLGSYVDFEMCQLPPDTWMVCIETE
jgi:hypothetical protein